MSWSKKTVVIAFAALAVLAVIFVIYGLLTHREAGLLLVCWGPDGTARYAEEVDGLPAAEGCSGVELRWPADAVPLRVGVLQSAPGLRERNEAVARGAVASLNAQLGFAMFRWAGPVADGGADVLVEFGHPHHGGSSADCRHERGEGDLAGRAVVRVRSVTSERALHRVLTHELGHAAGLAHDRFESSIMHGRVAEDDFDAALAYDLVTDHDVSLLRGLYAGR